MSFEVQGTSSKKVHKHKTRVDAERNAQEISRTGQDANVYTTGSKRGNRWLVSVFSKGRMVKNYDTIGRWK